MPGAEAAGRHPCGIAKIIIGLHCIVRGCPHNTDVHAKRFLIGCLGLAGFLPAVAFAAVPTDLTLRHDHHLFTLTQKDMKGWQSPRDVWMLDGKVIDPPAHLRVDGDDVPPLPAGFVRSTQVTWNEHAIRATLLRKVAPLLDRPAGSVTIARDGSGSIVFDGVGLPGRAVDIDTAASLISHALEQGVRDVWLPVRTTPAQVTITDSDLARQGIKEVVTVGESDMSNSPANRRYNIAVGLKKFNGHLIAKDETFSFLKVLGPVDASTGYKKELVIKGDRTVPDFGGGLCQVSSTAYRGIWEYGFPIVERRNHSYVVNHYAPYGTDATVYTSGPDMQFKNDSPGSLLIQTHSEGDNVYFIYYGTKDERRTKVIGPFVWDRVGSPPARTEFTADLAPGAKRKVGDAVPGLKAMWYRVVNKDGKEAVEEFFSWYQARPLFYQVGVSGAPSGSGEIVEPGDVVGSL